jgi:ABC-2 type transport system ATP-binding protein
LIEVKNFSKKYDNFYAVENLDLVIEKGDIFGFIGPNGAGKTTTIRFLATLLQPSRGRAIINGFDVCKQVTKVRHSIGYMPDNFGVYDGMKVWEFLDFFAMAYKLTRKKRKQVIDDVLFLVDLKDKRADYVNGLSRGMKQRLCLAKTLLHDPPVLILDEPASGLDPRARAEVQELLRELQNMGKTIVISSHILSELSGYCNKIGIIEKGKLLFQGPISDVMTAVREHQLIEITVIGDPKPLVDFLKIAPNVIELEEPRKGVIRFGYTSTIDDVQRLHRQLIEKEFQILWFRDKEISLEEVFLRMTKGEVQ